MRPFITTETRSGQLRKFETDATDTSARRATS
jgi:hypothetical protein